MSPLPQRKKSPEEIQQLRDQLGIRQKQASGNETTDPQESGKPEETVAPSQEKPKRPPVKSLKRSEREAPKPGQSTARTQAPPDSSSLPTRRRSKEELEELRRREALSNFSAQGQVSPFPKPASPFVITPGYLLAFFCTACQYWKQIPLEATAGAGAGALAIAGWIFACRKPSRHHSSFIAIITLLALTFAALHYFPQLRHAS